MLLTVATTITIFMLWKVVPVFEKMYASMGVKLPGATLVIVDASQIHCRSWKYFKNNRNNFYDQIIL